MKWVFIEFTSYSDCSKLSVFLHLLRKIGELGSKCSVKFFTADHSEKKAKFSSIITEIEQGHRRCNRVNMDVQDWTYPKLFPFARVRAQFIPNSRAFCWESVQNQQIVDSAADFKKKEWECLMMSAGVQKLNGREPSLVTIVGELDWEGTGADYESLLVFLIERMQEGGSPPPEDLRVYCRRGDDVYAGKGFNISVQTRTEKTNYDQWGNRFLAPREWIGAREDIVVDVAAALRLKDCIIRTTTRTESGHPIVLLRSETDPANIRDAGAEECFVTLES